MVFEKRGNTQFNSMYDDKILDIVNNFKYQVLHSSKMANGFKPQRALAALHNLFIVFNQIYVTAKDKCNLLDSLVGSILKP